MAEHQNTDQVKSVVNVLSRAEPVSVADVLRCLVPASAAAAKLLLGQALLRADAHDIMVALCTAPWFRPKYGEMLYDALCGALADGRLCPLSYYDSINPSITNSDDGVAYVMEGKSIDFESDDVGNLIPDYRGSRVEYVPASDGLGKNAEYVPTCQVSPRAYLGVDFVFVEACATGQLAAAQWLVRKFYIDSGAAAAEPPEDAKSHFDLQFRADMLDAVDHVVRLALELADRGGHADVVEWLERYGS